MCFLYLLDPSPRKIDKYNDKILVTRHVHNICSWLIVGLTTVILLVLYYVPQAFPNLEENYGNMQFIRAVRCCGWYCMLLVGIFYDGALTMYFTTEATVPFETTREVIQAYPDWKLQILQGDEVYFLHQAEDGDPDYTAFWDRVNNLPEETVFPNRTEGIRRAKEEFGVISIGESQLIGHLGRNPNERHGLKVFGRGRKEFWNTIVSNNSPFGPRLRYGTLHVVEQGISITVITLYCISIIQYNFTFPDVLFEIFISFVYLGIMSHIFNKGQDEKALSEETAMSQTTMRLNIKQLVLIFFIGTT